MPDMTREEEALADAKTRLQDLDHKVAQARDAAADAPTDAEARAALEMMVSIRDVAERELHEVEAKRSSA